MKLSFLLFALIFTTAISCKKVSSTINNTVDTSVITPQFVVNGIGDITLSNFSNFYTSIPITVQYLDSVQEEVSLSLSGLPAGVSMDSNWISSGIPSYTTTLTIFDTASAGVAPGAYPLTLTATTPSGTKKLYSFNLVIQPMPTTFLGKYTNCQFSCSGAITPYTDSLYLDPVTRNKVWFTNFGNTGVSAYGFVTLVDFEPFLEIPAQTIAGTTYSSPAMGTIFDLASHSFTLTITNAGSPGNCYLTMR